MFLRVNIRRKNGKPHRCYSVVVNRTTFVGTFRRAAWQQSLARDGCYLLRAYVPLQDGTPDRPAGMDQQAPVLWRWYMQLTHVEEAFKTLKSDLGIWSIHHQLPSRVEAHILVAFLAYCLSVTLRMHLALQAPGLSPRAVLAQLHLTLPQQPPPRIRHGYLVLPVEKGVDSVVET